MTGPSWTRSRLLALLLASALALVNVAGVAATLPRLAREGRVDFFTFLASARELRDGRSPYLVQRVVSTDSGSMVVHPNLNHPAALVLFLPLLAVGPPTAFWLWTLFGLACYLLAIALALRELRLAPHRWPGALVVALALAAPGAAYSAQLGQWALPLSLPMTVAWLFARHDRRVASAALLGLLVALKPFLLPLLALFAPWPGGARRPCAATLVPLAVAALAGALVSLAVLPMLGIQIYGDWLTVLRAVDWYSHGFNVSLAGLLSRLVTLARWQVWALTVVTVAAGLLALGRRPEASIARVDRDFGLLLVVALLAAPLGWLYYVVLLMPLLAAVVARWPELPSRPRRLVLAALALLWTPHFLMPLYSDALWSRLTLRAMSTYGLLLVMLALARWARPEWAHRPGAAGTVRPHPG